MKKIIVLAALIMSAFITQAQIVKSVTVTTTAATPTVDYATPQQISDSLKTIPLAAPVNIKPSIDSLHTIITAEIGKRISDSMTLITSTYPLVITKDAVTGVVKFSIASVTQTIALSGSYVITQGVNVISIDPSATMSSAVLTLPASFANGQNLVITAGGKIAVGASVVTSFSVVPAAGQKLYGSIPLTLKGGDTIVLNYGAPVNTFTKVN